MLDRGSVDHIHRRLLWLWMHTRTQGNWLDIRTTLTHCIRNRIYSHCLWWLTVTSTVERITAKFCGVNTTLIEIHGRMSFCWSSIQWILALFFCKLRFRNSFMWCSGSKFLYGLSLLQIGKLTECMLSLALSFKSIACYIYISESTSTN